MTMKGSKSPLVEGELSEGSFSVNGTNNDPFSQGTTPNASFTNMSFGTLNMMERLEQRNEREDNDWKDLESCIRKTTHSPTPQPQGQQGRGVSGSTQSSPPPQLGADVKFFEYPQLPADTAGRTVAPPEDSGFVKLFMGNMRFEMKRGTIAWAVTKACGAEVSIDPSKVLIHYKSSNGSQTPTGCASVFMDPADAKVLLEFNQRIFCGASGVYASLTSEAMRTLLRDKRVLDTGPDGRIRGPKHAVVIEMSRATPNTSFASSLQGGSYHPPAVAGNGSMAGPAGGGSPNGIQHFQPKQHHSSLQHQSPPPQQQPNHVAAALATGSTLNGIPTPVYHTYPGVGVEMAEPQGLVNPTEFFVGGICYEATPHFVAWMISLTGVKINSQNVTLFEDNKTGGKRGCAMVKVDGAVFPQIRAYHHRLLCDSRGVYVAESTQGIPAWIRQQKANGEVLRGPSHAVVIEKRRAQATPPPAYDGPPPPAYMNGGGAGGPPAPMPMPTTNWSMMPPVTGQNAFTKPPGLVGPMPAFTPQQPAPFVPGPTTPPSMPLCSTPPRPDGPPSPTMLARALGTPPSVSLADIPKPTWKNKTGSNQSTPRGGVSVSSQSSACGGN